MMVAGAESKQRRANDSLVQLGSPPIVEKYFVTRGIKSGRGPAEPFSSVPVVKSAHLHFNNSCDQRHTQQKCDVLQKRRCPRS